MKESLFEPAPEEFGARPPGNAGVPNLAGTPFSVSADGQIKTDGFLNRHNAHDAVTLLAYLKGRGLEAVVDLAGCPSIEPEFLRAVAPFGVRFTNATPYCLAAIQKHGATQSG